MESEPAQRVMDLFLDALERPPAERAAFVAQASAGDETLRDKVEALLRCETAAPDFLAQPVFELGADLLAELPQGELRPGDVLGDCRIVSLLGVGGMGEVYLADDTALGRRVALKLIQRGATGANLLAHFRHERRVLAGLNHANIARLYGGAVTPQGRAYLVMEYVDGERLDVYCNRRRLPVSARLELFRKICLAVAYAHQNLIIHRDLKPANIRVTPEGEPKLLDFGIAKLLESDGTGRAEQTVTQVGSMTPGYASPEQLSGAAVNTATDVYSLGVILCELLCGSRPDKTSLRPSAAPITDPIAQARGTTPVRLRRRLAGDLDTIALKAIRQDPARRYASVSQLSDDLRRHLNGQPVTARKETLRYIGAKFIARNKALTAAAALVLLTLLAGIAGTSWQARVAQAQRLRAERRFDDVRQLAHSLMFEIHDSVQPLAGSTPTRRLIVTRALQYLDRLNREAADNPSLRRDLASAYTKIGEIQGNPYSANLGDIDGALVSYRKAESLRQPDATGAGNPPLEARMELGRTYRGLADILDTKGDYQGMARYYRRSLDVFEQLGRERPKDPAVADEIARADEAVGDGYLRMKDSQPERLHWYEQSIAVRQRLYDAAPTLFNNRRAMAVLCIKLGRTYMPDKERAVATLKRGSALLKALSQENPDNMVARRMYALGLYSLADIQNQTGAYPEAVRNCQESLAIRQTVAAADPSNSQAQFDLAAAQGLLGTALAGAGQPEAAIEPASISARSLEALTAANRGAAFFVHNFALACDSLGDVLSAAAARDPSRWAQARDSYEKALKIFNDQRANGSLRSSDEDKIAELSAKIATCAEGLQKSAAASPEH